MIVSKFYNHNSVWFLFILFIYIIIIIIIIIYLFIYFFLIFQKQFVFKKQYTELCIHTVYVKMPECQNTKINKTNS